MTGKRLLSQALCTFVAGLVLAASASGQEKAPKAETSPTKTATTKPKPKQTTGVPVSKDGLTNAALRTYGSRASIELAKGAGMDKRTAPEDTFDGNPHTRCVVWGLPYTFTIELLDRLPVERLGFAHSDYQKEMAPKDIEIELDDGTRIQHSLELKYSSRTPAWQYVPVGKEVKVIKVTVKSNHEGAVNWGGLGEIGVFTKADLNERLKVPDYDPAAPAFVNVPALAAGTVAKVHLPPSAKPGEHPRCLVTKEELAELKKDLQTTEKGKDLLAKTIALADGMLEQKLDFPDPNGPGAQLKDRSDDLAKKHDYLAKIAGTTGVVYAVTGEKKYAQKAREVLVGYGKLYEQYPMHKGVNASDQAKVFAQRLSEAMWLIQMLYGLDFIYDSALLSEEDRKLIETGLVRPCVACIRGRSPDKEVQDRDRSRPNWRTDMLESARPKTTGNWLNFYTAATMMAGAILEDKNMVDLAVADMRELLKVGISDDGMWGEGAIGYQLFAVAAMIPAMETAARQGHDLWSYDNSRVKKLFDSPLAYAYPDGTAPGIHDSGRAKLGSWETQSYDYAYLRYRDERFAVLVNQSPRQLHPSPAIYFPSRVFQLLPTPKSMAYPSTVYTSQGYAILRDSNTYLLMDCGPHGGVHGHPDKLNLLVFDGDELGGEPAFYRYEDALHGTWTKTTVAHNTMAVDCLSQLPCEGKLLAFEDCGAFKIMRAQVAGAYPGVLLDRTVVFTGGAIIDLCRGRSALSHTWDRSYQFRGKIREFKEPKEDANSLGTRDGYQNLKLSERRAAEKAWQTTWETPVGKLHLVHRGAEGQEAIFAAGPAKENLMLVRRQGTSADFGAVLWMDNWGQSPKSVSFTDAGDPKVAAFTMEKDGATTTVIVSHRAGPWEAMGWESDAQVLCVQQRGAELKLAWTGGTFASSSQGSVKLDAAGNCLAEGKAGELKVVSSWQRP